MYMPSSLHWLTAVDANEVCTCDSRIPSKDVRDHSLAYRDTDCLRHEGQCRREIADRAIGAMKGSKTRVPRCDPAVHADVLCPQCLQMVIMFCGGLGQNREYGLWPEGRTREFVQANRRKDKTMMWLSGEKEDAKHQYRNSAGRDQHG